MEFLFEVRVRGSMVLHLDESTRAIRRVVEIGVIPSRQTMDKKDVVSNLGSSKDPIINKLLFFIRPML